MEQGARKGSPCQRGHESETNFRRCARSQCGAEATRVSRLEPFESIPVTHNRRNGSSFGSSRLAFPAPLGLSFPTTTGSRPPPLLGSSKAPTSKPQAPAHHVPKEGAECRACMRSFPLFPSNFRTHTSSQPIHTRKISSAAEAPVAGAQRISVLGDENAPEQSCIVRAHGKERHVERKVSLSGRR